MEEVKQEERKKVKREKMKMKVKKDKRQLSVGHRAKTEHETKMKARQTKGRMRKE